MDTGADISIISEETRKVLFPTQKIYESDLILKTYTGEPITIIGTCMCVCSTETNFTKLVMVVVEGNGSSLLGRNWLKYLRLDQSRIAQLNSTRLKTLNSVLDQHKVLFEEALGTVEPYRATLHVKSDATPKFTNHAQCPSQSKGLLNGTLTKWKGRAS